MKGKSALSNREGEVNVAVQCWCQVLVWSHRKANAPTSCSAELLLKLMRHTFLDVCIFLITNLQPLEGRGIFGSVISSLGLNLGTQKLIEKNTASLAKYQDNIAKALKGTIGTDLG